MATFSRQIQWCLSDRYRVSRIYSEQLFSTDASLTGCGAICEGEYFHELFPPIIIQQQLSIMHLELLTVVVAIKLWQLNLKGRCIMIHCDNQACVKMINSMRSKNVFLQACLRELWLTSCSRLRTFLDAKIH